MRKIEITQFKWGVEIVCGLETGYPERYWYDSDNYEGAAKKVEDILKYEPQEPQPNPYLAHGNGD